MLLSLKFSSFFCYLGPASGDDQHEKSPTTEEASVPEEEDSALKSLTEDTSKGLDTAEEAPVEIAVKEEEEDVKEAWDVDSEEEEDDNEEEGWYRMCL